MLDYLRIHNFALIENLEIDCSKNLNAITGETGSGKSIILGALSLLLGERADNSCIRFGEDSCVVDASISLDPDHSLLAYLRDKGYEIEDDVLLIRRVIKKNSKSSIFLNGQSITRNELSYIGECLFDMHGQSEHQSLLKAEKQRELLDSYANIDISDYRKSYEGNLELKKRIGSLQELIDKALQDQDYMEFALSEIKKLDPKPDEVEDLKEKIHIASQYENISQSLSDCSQYLKGSIDGLYNSSNELQKASRLDLALKEYYTRLQSSLFEIDDINQSINQRLSNFTFSPEELDDMQNRLALLQRLYKKYGGSYESLVKFRDDAIFTLSSSDEKQIELSKLEKAQRLQEEKTLELAKDLSQKRQEAARKLCRSIEENLHDLGMANAVFTIAFTQVPLCSYGIDEVCFTMCANLGEASGPIAKIASGGELSRVMLALKTTLAKNDEIQTLIFDEIDSGIGGSVALAVGNKLKALSKAKQVITITHLASIACLADKHFVVSKETVDNRTYTRLLEASGDTRVKEIARMLSGSLDEASISHARSLLEAKA